MDEPQTDKQYEDFVFIIHATNASISWPERERLIAHFTADYLRSLGIPLAQTVVVSNELEILSWASKEGYRIYQLNSRDNVIMKIIEDFPKKHILILSTISPVREADLLSLMCSQVKTSKEEVFVSAYMGAKENEGEPPEWKLIVDGSVWGFRYDSNFSQELKTNLSIDPKKEYYVAHSAECGHYLMNYPYTYNKKVLETAVKEGFKLSAWSAPCPADYPRRVQIKIDKL